MLYIFIFLQYLVQKETYIQGSKANKTTQISIYKHPNGASWGDSERKVAAEKLLLLRDLINETVRGPTPVFLSRKNEATNPWNWW